MLRVFPVVAPVADQSVKNRVEVNVSVTWDKRTFDVQKLEKRHHAYLLGHYIKLFSNAYLPFSICK